MPGTKATTNSALVERAVRFERETLEQAASRVEPHPLGRWIYSDEHPKLWGLNQLYVEGRQPALTADGLMAELDRGLAHTGHRRAVVTDDATGRQIEADMRAAGFVVVPLMVMLLDGETPEPPPGVVRELDVSEMSALERRLTDDLGEIPEADRDEVVTGFIHQRSVPGTRHYAGVLDGENVCGTTLYSHGGTAQPEHVVTLRSARGRGIAAAVVSRATLDAVAAGCDLVFMVCDAALGPYGLYAGLGYRAAGRIWTFTLPAE